MTTSTSPPARPSKPSRGPRPLRSPPRYHSPPSPPHKDTLTRTHTTHLPRSRPPPRHRHRHCRSPSRLRPRRTPSSRSPTSGHRAGSARRAWWACRRPCARAWTRPGWASVWAWASVSGRGADCLRTRRRPASASVWGRGRVRARWGAGSIWFGLEGVCVHAHAHLVLGR